MITIEIDGLPFFKMVIFHGELLNNQMVYIITINNVDPTTKWSVRSTAANSTVAGGFTMNSP